MYYPKICKIIIAVNWLAYYNICPLQSNYLVFTLSFTLKKRSTIFKVINLGRIFCIMNQYHLNKRCFVESNDSQEGTSEDFQELQRKCTEG